MSDMYRDAFNTVGVNQTLDKGGPILYTVTGTFKLTTPGFCGIMTQCPSSRMRTGFLFLNSCLNNKQCGTRMDHPTKMVKLHG